MPAEPQHRCPSGTSLTTKPAAASSSFGSRVIVLAVLHRAGGVIGDREPVTPPSGSRPSSARYSVMSRASAETVGRLRGIGRIVAQHEAVVLDRRAAARGGDDDGVEPLALDLARSRRRYWRARGERAVLAAHMMDERAAAAAPGATTTSTPWRFSSRMVASLIAGASTGWTQPASSATRACGARPRPGRPAAGRPASGPAAARRQLQHGGELRRPSARSSGAKRPRQPAAPQRPGGTAPDRAARAPAARAAAGRAAAGGRSPRYARGRDRPDACSARRTGRWSCRRGRTGSGRYA